MNVFSTWNIVSSRIIQYLIDGKVVPLLLNEFFAEFPKIVCYLFISVQGIGVVCHLAICKVTTCTQGDRKNRREESESKRGEREREREVKREGYYQNPFQSRVRWRYRAMSVRPARVSWKGRETPPLNRVELERICCGFWANPLLPPLGGANTL